MKGVDVQLDLEFLGKQQRGGLKRHFPAHQGCHNTPSFQSTLSLSQQTFKPFEGKREMRRPQDPSLVQHSLDCSHIINNQVFQKGQLQVMDVGVSAGYKLRQEHPCLHKTGNPWSPFGYFSALSPTLEHRVSLQTGTKDGFIYHM